MDTANKIQENLPIPNVNIKKTITIVAGVGIAALAYVIISRRIKKQQEEKNFIEMQGEMGGDSTKAQAVKFATLYFSAMDGWGTNEQLIYSVTKQIKKAKVPFKEVAKAYKKLYNKHLLEHIQSELNSGEFIVFQSILNR